MKLIKKVLIFMIFHGKNQKEKNKKKYLINF